MSSTIYVDFTAAVRGVGNRTNAAGTAVPDYSAEEDRLAQVMLTQGALTDQAFLVQPSANMDIAVGSGSAKADVYVVEGTVAGQGVYLARLDQTPVTYTVPAADASQARIDEVYLVVADSAYDGGSVSLPRIGYREGDPGGAAPGPDPNWKASAKLATVNVAAGATAIAAGDITDERTEATSTLGIGQQLVLSNPNTSVKTVLETDDSGYFELGVDSNGDGTVDTYVANVVNGELRSSSGADPQAAQAYATKGYVDGLQPEAGGLITRKVDTSGNRSTTSSTSYVWSGISVTFTAPSSGVVEVAMIAQNNGPERGFWQVECNGTSWGVGAVDLNGYGHVVQRVSGLTPGANYVADWYFCANTSSGTAIAANTSTAAVMEVYEA